MSPIRMAGVKKVAQSLAEANLLDCTLKAWIWGHEMEKHVSRFIRLKGNVLTAYFVFAFFSFTPRGYLASSPHSLGNVNISRSYVQLSLLNSNAFHEDEYLQFSISLLMLSFLHQEALVSNLCTYLEICKCDVPIRRAICVGAGHQ